MPQILIQGTCTSLLGRTSAVKVGGSVSVRKTGFHLRSPIFDHPPVEPGVPTQHTLPHVEPKDPEYAVVFIYLFIVRSLSV